MARKQARTEEDFPEAGTVFVAPTGDGRLAAGRVLRRQFEGGAFGALVAASRWIGREVPPLDLVELRETLVLTHHRWQATPEIFWAHSPMPADFTAIGRIELPPEDREASSFTFGGWHSVPLQALLQWRWDHDREALLREEAANAVAEAQRRQKAAAARAMLLRSLTLDSLAERKWLADWDSPSPGSPVAESRALLAQLVRELRAVPKLTKTTARRLMRQSVRAFNRLDSPRPFITTMEREELCEAYEQFACAAGFPELADEIDRWREW
ncbi:MAG: hypothetical protein AB7F89_13495 [Pirellulaceae bacterium]